MKLRITKANSNFGTWYNNRIGQEFEVVGFHAGIPNQYEVDVSALKESGDLTVDRAYVFESHCEVLRVPVSPAVKAMVEDIISKVTSDSGDESRTTMKYEINENLHHEFHEHSFRWVIEEIGTRNAPIAGSNDRRLVEILQDLLNEQGAFTRREQGIQYLSAAGLAYKLPTDLDRW